MLIGTRSRAVCAARDDTESPAIHANASVSGFSNSSGPRAQYSRDESPDQCSHSPASFVTLATGIDLMSGPISTVLPVRTNGALLALMTVMKGLPLAYQKDMQEDKLP